MSRCRFIMPLSIILSMLLLISCAVTPATSQTPERPGHGTVEPTPDRPVGWRAVTDQAGRTVVLDARPERIVSGFYISTSTIMAIGVADRLVGIEARAESRPIYELANPELLTLPSVGTARDFNLEACLELRPDLVILPYRQREVAEILYEMNVPAILVNPESVDEMLEMIALIGNATGAESSANRLIGWYQSALAEIRQQVAGVTEKPVVYMTGTSSWLTTSSNDMFQAWLIDVAGGINATRDIEGSGRIEVSYEQLLAMNPDIIIIPPEADFGIRNILYDPNLSQLTAVRNRRVYKMTPEYEAWDSPIPSSILGAKWLTRILHGGHDSASAVEDITPYVISFYEDFFGYKFEAPLPGT